MSVTTKVPFKRPQFTALPPKSGSEDQPAVDTITSLPDLIEFNARHNPDHVFCIQARSPSVADRTNNNNGAFDAHHVTFAQLDSAVHACARTISTLISPTQESDGEPQTPGPGPGPLALYLESDVGLFFHLAALLALKVPVLLISIRLSPPSVQHLLETTGCKTVLVSKRTRPMLESHIDPQFHLQSTKPYESFLSPRSSTRHKDTVPQNSKTATGNNKTARPLILHSSGTTGFPKPIRLSARYPLQYAACHEFPPDEAIDWVNLSTLPLYHGFGFLAPCLSLSVGMTCCFPPPHIIPAGASTHALLEAFHCQSLMTVPSIVDDLVALSDGGGGPVLACLSTLKFLAVGGGALGLAQGTRLADEQGVKLLLHYGVTEIGALAPIFCPGPDYNWRFLRLRADLGLALRPIPQQQQQQQQDGAAAAMERFKLVGWPHGWDEPFEVQDELERRSDDANSRRTEVRILGRTDDVIVLRTGEKVRPQHLEAVLHADPVVKTAVCLGDGFFEVVVLVEQQQVDDSTEGRPSNALVLEPSQLVDHVWDLITSVNAELDSHARVSAKSAIIVMPAHKRIPRTDKGSVSRRQMYQVFAEEIEAAYVALENEQQRPGIGIETGGSVETMIAKMVGRVFTNHDALDHSRDLFEQGMDSLQALRLARMIEAATRQSKSSSEGTRTTAEFVYRHPSIETLSAALRSLVLAGRGDLEAQRPDSGSSDRSDRHAQMLSRLEQYIVQSQTANASTSKPPRDVVLLTGATGSLGAHVLGQLTSSQRVETVICLYRKKPAQKADSGPYDAAARLKACTTAAGVVLGDDAWAKVTLIEDVEVFAHSMRRNGHTSGHGQEPSLSNLSASITHIVHLAWPMDFHRTLESFDPHLQMLQALIDLARVKEPCQQTGTLPKRKPRVRLLFASSIAVVRNFSSGGATSRIPETVMNSPATVAPMGYAEAKWICEHMMAHAAQEFGQDLEPAVVRIGQLSGPEASAGGVWKTGEHIPTLVRASHKISAFPDLPGTLSWIPVDRAARSLVEMLFHKGELGSVVLHLENPVRQPANQIMTLISSELGLGNNKQVVPFDEWLARVKEAGLVESLADFFDNDFLALAHTVLDTTGARRVSRTLRGSSGLTREVVAKYVGQWKHKGLFD